MGHGCYFTNSNDSKAVWIDLYGYISEEDDPNVIDYHLDYIYSDLNDTLINLGYDKDDNYLYSNGLYNVELKIEPYDNLVIYLNFKHCDYYYLEGLAEYNHYYSYKKIQKALIAQGYKLCVATSAWTSTELIID